MTEQIRDEKKGLFIALDDINAQPSLARIFSIIEIGPLSDKEVREFFERTFNSVNMKVERKAMKFMVHYSTGLPFLMKKVSGREGISHRSFAVTDQREKSSSLLPQKNEEARNNRGRQRSRSRFIQICKRDVSRVLLA